MKRFSVFISLCYVFELQYEFSKISGLAILGFFSSIFLISTSSTSLSISKGICCIPFLKLEKKVLPNAYDFLMTALSSLSWQRLQQLKFILPKRSVLVHCLKISFNEKFIALVASILSTVITQIDSNKTKFIILYR